MPQSSYIYACARIRCLENGLLSAPAIRRMADGTLEDAMRVLADARYGGIPDASVSDIERMIEYETGAAAREVLDLSPDPELTDLFLLYNDVQNLKMLLKARMLGSSEAGWQPGGLFGREELANSVRDQKYDLLPSKMAEDLGALENSLKVSVDPQRISVALDQAYMRYCIATSDAHRSAFAAFYFREMADYDNLLTFLRMRGVGGAREETAGMLLPEGYLSVRSLMAAFDQPMESLTQIVRDYPAYEPLRAGIEEVIRTGRIGALEKARDDRLISLVRERRFDTDTIFPILGYYLARVREAQAIRLIITAKKNGLDDSVIAERLRVLYV